LKKDISEFEPGDVIETVNSGLVFRVERYFYSASAKKRRVESSICTSMQTGEEVIITWPKKDKWNPMFEKYKGEFKISK
jgi:hypothetical protein